MEILPGYAYHIKDSYFTFANDPFLMQNKEEGNYRPTLYCVKDEATGLYWMVPITSQYEKFSTIREKIVNSRKQCKGIVLGEYDDRKAAFLIPGAGKKGITEENQKKCKKPFSLKCERNKSYIYGHCETGKDAEGMQER